MTEEESIKTEVKRSNSRKTILIVGLAIIGLFVVASLFSLQKTGQVTIPLIEKVVGPTCGNNVCESGETAATCCKDCGCPSSQRCDNNVCKTYCGNGICDSDESKWICCKDCGCPVGYQCINDECRTYCGNGQCDADENCNTCPQDCKCVKPSVSINAQGHWGLFQGCYATVSYTITNMGNAAGANTILTITAVNPALNVLRDTQSVSLGTIYPSGTYTGSKDIDFQCSDNKIEITGKVTIATGETDTDTTVIYP